MRCSRLFSSAGAGWLVALFVLSLLLAGRASAGDEPKAEPPAVGDAAPPASDDASKPEPPVLHKIYVPFRDLGKIFEKEGEGVFLPYEEFLSLWRRANRPTSVEGPPVSAAIRAASYEGEAKGDLVTLDATFEVEVLAPGWQRIALPFAGAGIEEATVEGEPALVLPRPKGVYELLLRDPGRRTLVLRLRVPAKREGDDLKASFSLPPVPLSRLRLDFPGRATDVDVRPRIASSTEPQPGGTTRLVAFLGAVDHIELTWRQKEEQAPAEQPLVFAEVQHDVRADPGVVRTETVASLSILRSPLTHLAFSVPADVVVLYVQGDGLRTWERSDDGTRLDLDLRDPVRERWQVKLGLERPLPPLPAELSIPLPRLEGVERETGFLRLLSGEGIKVESVATDGLLQVDLAEMPDALRKAPGGRAEAWRFPTRPGDVRVRAESLLPRVSAGVGQRVTIRPEGTGLAASVALRVERAGIFSVDLDLPGDLEVTEVHVKGPVGYDDHQVREVDGRRVLTVSFTDRLLGEALVEVKGRRATPLPAEGATVGESSFEIPLLRFPTADFVQGYLALHVDPSIEHREAKRTGLVPLDPNAPAAEEPPAEPALPPLARRFEYLQGDLALTLALKRRAPSVEAEVQTSLRFEPDRVRVQTTLDYRVSYRGVDTFRFTAPLSLKDRLHLDLEGVQLLGPEAVEVEGKEPTRGLWTVKLPADRLGAVPIALQVDDVPEAALASGTSRRFEVPTFVPMAAEGGPLPNVTHYVSVRRDPLLEITTEKLDRAEEIDARELPAPLRGEDDFLALRAYEPEWAATLVVTRHDYEPVAEVVISHLHLDTVVHQDRATTEAYFVVRNNDRQSLRLRLPHGASIRALTVDGQSRAPRQGEPGEEDIVLVPLQTGRAKDDAFTVALVYDHDVKLSSGLVFDDWTLSSPVPLDVKADLLTWRVYPPANLEYVGVGGTVEPAEPYRSWFGSLVQGLFRSIGPTLPQAETDVAGEVRGFQSPLQTPRDGRWLLFHNRLGTGTVEIRGVKPGLFAFVSLLFFALALTLGLVAGRRLARSRLGEGAFFVGAVVVVLALLVPAGKGSAQVLDAVLYGLLLAAVVRFLARALAAARARRAAAAAAAPPSEPPASLPEGGVA